MKELTMRKCGAIVLAAGKGSRMKSQRAKVVFLLAEKPLIQRVVDTALSMDCDPVSVVVGHQKEKVIECIRPDGRLKFIEQKEQHGTGHAVIIAKESFSSFDGDVFILCGDVPLLSRTTLQKLLDSHRDEDAACTVLTVSLENPGSYGRIVRNNEGSVERIVEYKDATPEEREIKEINSGIYCFDCKSLCDARSKINNDNMQGEYYLTDTLEILKTAGKKVRAVVTDDLVEVSGVNSQQQLAELETEHYRRIREYWLNNGVSIENPSSVIIGDSVHIEPDVDIASNTVIKGNTRIGSFSYIGPNSFLHEAIISENVVLEGYNIVNKVTIHDNTRVKFRESRDNG
jgi:bifunctional UDP-N-acetylglucosamine pyrophosphorylase / glucosamine-1-phosphate N-acetyltransferase